MCPQRIARQEQLITAQLVCNIVDVYRKPGTGSRHSVQLTARQNMLPSGSEPALQSIPQKL